MNDYKLINKPYYKKIYTYIVTNLLKERICYECTTKKDLKNWVYKNCVSSSQHEYLGLSITTTNNCINQVKHVALSELFRIEQVK